MTPTKTYEYIVIHVHDAEAGGFTFQEVLNSYGENGYRLLPVAVNRIIMEKEVVNEPITEDQCLARLVELVDSGSKSGSRRARQCVKDLYDQIQYYVGKEL